MPNNGSLTPFPEVPSYRIELMRDGLDLTDYIRIYDSHNRPAELTLKDLQYWLTSRRVPTVIQESGLDLPLGDELQILQFVDGEWRAVDLDTDIVPEGTTNLYLTESRFISLFNQQEIDQLSDVIITTPNNGQALIYLNGVWVNDDLPDPFIPDLLNDLSDVTISAPINNQVLSYVNGVWVNNDLPNPTIPDTLDELSDVTINAPTNSQILSYSNGVWINSNLPTVDVPELLNDLDDVVITDPVDNQVLSYINDQWVNATTPVLDVPEILDDLDDVIITNPFSQQILKYISGSWVNSNLYEIVNLSLIPGEGVLTFIRHASANNPNIDDFPTLTNPPRLFYYNGRGRWQDRDLSGVFWYFGTARYSLDEGESPLLNQDPIKRIGLTHNLPFNGINDPAYLDDNNAEMINIARKSMQTQISAIPLTSQPIIPGTLNTELVELIFNLGEDFLLNITGVDIEGYSNYLGTEDGNFNGYLKLKNPTIYASNDLLVWDTVGSSNEIWPDDDDSPLYKYTTCSTQDYYRYIKVTIEAENYSRQWAALLGQVELYGNGTSNITLAHTFILPEHNGKICIVDTIEVTNVKLPLESQDDDYPIAFSCYVVNKGVKPLRIQAQPNTELTTLSNYVKPDGGGILFKIASNHWTFLNVGNDIDFGANTRELTSTTALSDDDTFYQILDPNGFDRDLVYGQRTKPIWIINNTDGTNGFYLKETFEGSAILIMKDITDGWKSVLIIPSGGTFVLSGISLYSISGGNGGGGNNISVYGLNNVLLTNVLSSLTFSGNISTSVASGAVTIEVLEPDLPPVAISGSYNDLTNKPTLGTAASKDVGTSALNVVQLNGSGHLPILNAAALTDLNASALIIGTVPTARLGTGTANSTTYLRGDGSWVSIAADGFLTSVGLSAPNIFVVTGSPITSSGVLDIAFQTQTANKVLASLTSGTGIPTFRALDPLDIPNLDASKINAGTFNVARLGSGTANATTYLRGDGSWATVSTGSVTSVALSAPAIFSVSGSPVTGNGTLTFTLQDQTANKVLASLTSGTGTPTFRTLDESDIPSLDASKINAGTFNVARLGSGTADSTTYLRGDGSWSIISSGVSSVGLSAPSIFTVTNSPVTGSGTLTFALQTQLANRVLASGISGGAVVPTFRILDAQDIPDLDAAKITTGLIDAARLGSGAAHSGTFLRGDNSWASPVTSVGLSAPSIFTVTNSPVISTGVLTFTLTSQTANRFFAAPNGSDGAPVFRAMTTEDVPTLDAAKIGTGVINPARLGSGIANSTTYLRGDNTWVTVSSGGASAFTNLTDAPTSYTGQAGKLVAVNSGTTGLEFYTPSRINSFGIDYSFPAVRTYTVDLYCVRAYLIKSIWFKMGSGTITFSLRKNGAAITGLTDLVATTSIQNAVATALNSFQIGDTLTLVVTVSSNAVDFAATVETEYASL